MRIDLPPGACVRRPKKMSNRYPRVLSAFCSFLISAFCLSVVAQSFAAKSKMASSASFRSLSSSR